MSTLYSQKSDLDSFSNRAQRVQVKLPAKIIEFSQNQSIASPIRKTLARNMSRAQSKNKISKGSIG